MPGQHPGQMSQRKLAQRKLTTRAEQMLRDKLRRVREGLSNGRYTPEQLDAVMKAYEIFLRHK